MSSTAKATVRPSAESAGAWPFSNTIGRSTSARSALPVRRSRTMTAVVSPSCAV
ncbi:hypothetical protein RB200_26160 [Streptomyces sp. PmtG]